MLEKVREGTGNKGTKVTPVEYKMVVQRMSPYTKTLRTRIELKSGSSSIDFLLEFMVTVSLSSKIPRMDERCSLFRIMVAPLEVEIII